MRTLFLLVATLMVSSCTSTNRIAENGVSFAENPDGSVVIRVEGVPSSSDEILRKNVLHHAARYTIDHGSLYFRLEDFQTAKSTRAKRSDVDRGEDLTGERRGLPGETRPSSTERYSSTYSLSREGTAEGRFVMFREKPAGQDAVLEAMAVIEQTSH